MRTAPPQVYDLTQGVVDMLGYTLWGVELLAPRDGKQLLRVYIEAVDGVNLDDCAKVSRQLSACLDVEDPISGEYTLEVSSPGVDRVIFTPGQFALLVGSTVRVKLLAMVAGRKNYRGSLLAVSETNIQLQVDNETVDLLFDEIDTARVVPKF